MKKKILLTAAVLTAVVTIAAVVITSKDKLLELLPDAVSGPLETHKGSVPQNNFYSDDTTTETPAEETTFPETTIPETIIPETTVPQTEPPVTEPPVTEPPVTEPITIDNVPQHSPGYFDSSLFIGDSRTVGLRDFADLGKATVFASKGMNVFRIAKESVDVPGYGNADLNEILNAKKYDKIYVMLGINEIGYNPNSVIKKYTEIIDMVKTAQPEAKIYIQANLHITALRSNSDEVYNNTKLNTLNEGMKAIANGTSIVYIDANAIFDDESGCLDEKYASDNFHLFAKYYPIWADWIALNS